jgi:hypothetical protein
MSTKGSEKFALSKEDLKKVIRTAMIIYSPVILLFLDQIQK